MSTAVVEEKKSKTQLNQLEQLKKFTKVVADTADPDHSAKGKIPLAQNCPGPSPVRAHNFDPHCLMATKPFEAHD